MTAIAAPETRRIYQDIPPINRYQNDLTLENGTRICTPVYVDVSMANRKTFLNEIRQRASEPIEATSQPDSVTGIQVVNYSTAQPAIEAYLGMSIDILRNCLFQRGGLEISLVLKLQEVTGIILITEKDLAAAFKLKHGLVKSFSKDYPFHT